MYNHLQRVAEGRLITRGNEQDVENSASIELTAGIRSLAC